MKPVQAKKRNSIAGGLLIVILIAVGLTACGNSDSAEHSPVGVQQTNTEITAAPPPPEGAPTATETQSPGKFLLSREERGLPPELAPLNQVWSGDFDAMVERRVIRVLTVFQVPGYFLDGPQERGITYDLVKMFEKSLNEQLNTGHIKLHVVVIPVAFDQLLPALEQGYGDIAAAGLSITPQRLKTVDFGTPLYRDVSEVIVTGPASPSMTSVDDLSGKMVYIKPGSSYREGLEMLNEEFRAGNRAEIEIRDAQPLLQDIDLLEMVSAGLLPMIVMDDYKARLWAEILDGLQVREDLVVQSGRQIAWAFRKNSPLLAAQINEFTNTHRKGTLMGNILIKRYFKNTKWVNNALDATEFGRFEDTLKLFKEYADYHTDPVNLGTHYVGLPMGGVAVFGLLSRIEGGDYTDAEIQELKRILEGELS